MMPATGIVFFVRHGAPAPIDSPGGMHLLLNIGGLFAAADKIYIWNYFVTP